jgi:hypothetical protein
MSGVPAVIVKKGGFLSALFHGVFGFLTVVVICASGLGFYALHIADDTLDDLFSMTRDAVAGLPEWKQNMPPLLAELLDDRRAPDYRAQVETSAKMVASSRRADREQAIVEVTNNGSETITVLALNMVLEDRNGVPVCEKRVYAATPIAVDDDDWRGPLFPGDTRRFAVLCYGAEEELRPTVQVAELRVWNGPRGAEAAEARAPTAGPSGVATEDVR